MKEISSKHIPLGRLELMVPLLVLPIGVAVVELLLFTPLDGAGATDLSMSPFSSSSSDDES